MTDKAAFAQPESVDQGRRSSLRDPQAHSRSHGACRCTRGPGSRSGANGVRATEPGSRPASTLLSRSTASHAARAGAGRHPVPRCSAGTHHPRAGTRAACVASLVMTRRSSDRRPVCLRVGPAQEPRSRPLAGLPLTPRDHRPERLRPPPHPLGVQPARRARADHGPRRHGVKHGFDCLAVTDHGALYGAVAFYQAATKAGIKPIIGVETYVARRSMRDKEGKADSQPFHLILLATDMVGYRNLCRLVTDAHLDGYYYKPRIDREHLAKLQRGPGRAVSACLGGEVPKALEVDDWDLARQVAGELPRHPRQGPVLPRAPGPRHPRAAPAQRAAAPARARDRAAAGRHQRPALRPSRAARGARRPAVRRHRQQPRHAEPDEVRDARLLPQDRGRDGGAVPGPARGAPQHAPDRRDGRPRAAAGRAADPALPGARRRDRRDVAAQGVRGGPGPALRRDHARAPEAPRLRAGRDHLDGLRRLLPDRGRLRPLRPGAGDRDDLPGLRARARS